ncbi:hypothetical protein EDC48_111133 [Gibbsiella quercinecans]|nr:hypothetical protein EDC48_111133 [Gibbsiella quercinecans]
MKKRIIPKGNRCYTVMSGAYRYLPETPAIPPGHINMSTLPLKEVLPIYLYSCTQLVASMHGGKS